MSDVDEQDCIVCGAPDAYIHTSLEFYICAECDDDNYHDEGFDDE